MPQGDVVPATDPTFIAVVARRGYVHFPPYLRYAESGMSFKQFDEFKRSCGFNGDIIYVTMTHDERKRRYDAAGKTTHEHLKKTLQILEIIMSPTVPLNDEDFFLALSDTLVGLELVTAHFAARTLPFMKAAADQAGPSRGSGPPPSTPPQVSTSGGSAAGTNWHRQEDRMNSVIGAVKELVKPGPKAKPGASTQQPSPEQNARFDRMRHHLAEAITSAQGQGSTGAGQSQKVRERLADIIEAAQDGMSPEGRQSVRAYLDTALSDEVVSALLGEDSAPASMRVILACRT